MQIGAEVTVGGLSPHRRHYAVAHHEAAQVRAFGLADEFLHDEIGV